MTTIIQTGKNKLKLNRLTKTQFDSAQNLSDDELYLVDPEFSGNKIIATTASGDIKEVVPFTAGSSAPTTSTVGVVGQIYEDTTNGYFYVCTAVSGSTYTWNRILTNESTASSALAILGWAGANSLGVRGNASASGAVALGVSSSAVATQSTAVGYVAAASAQNAIQIGRGSNSTANTLQIGFGGTSYRLLDGTDGTIPGGRAPRSVYDRTKAITSGSIALDDGTVFYTDSPSVATTYTIDSSALTQSGLTYRYFNVLINMPASAVGLDFTTNNSVTWTEDTTPDMTVGGRTYLLAFQTFDGGTTWIGSLCTWWTTLTPTP